MENLRIELSKNLKPKPQDETKLGFGNIFTDHMFLMDYDEGQGCLLYTSCFADFCEFQHSIYMSAKIKGLFLFYVLFCNKWGL